jgi:hypothetical protein
MLAVLSETYAGREGRSNEGSWAEEGRKAAREWRRRQKAGQAKLEAKRNTGMGNEETK